MTQIYYSVLKSASGNKYWLASGVFLGLPFVHLVTKPSRGVRLIRVIGPTEGKTECSYHQDKTYLEAMSTNEAMRRLDKGTRQMVTALLEDPSKKAPPLTDKTAGEWVHGVVAPLVK